MATIYTAQGMPIKKPAIKDGRITVYNLVTGEPSECHAIDAKDRVKSGGWSYDKTGKTLPDKRIGADEIAVEKSGEHFDLAGGSWFTLRGQVKEELGLDKAPKSKQEAAKLLREAGYEVTGD